MNQLYIGIYIYISVTYSIYTQYTDIYSYVQYTVTVYIYSYIQYTDIYISVIYIISYTQQNEYICM